MAIPSPLVRINATQQSGPTSWSAYGAQVENLLVTVYPSCETMFSQTGPYYTGQIDIADCPVINKVSDLNNQDFFVTNLVSDFDVFQLDINHAHPFFSVSFHAPRVPPVPAVKSITTSPLPGGTCAAGQNRYTILLDNQEEGNAAIQDPLNRVTITQTPSGSPSITVSGNSANNMYDMGCLPADNYAVRTTVYKGSGTVTALGPGLAVTVTLSVDYNSNSNVKETPAGIEISKALSHMLDKPRYLADPRFQAQGRCRDVQAPPGQGLQGDCGQLPVSTLQEDCASHPTLPCNPVSLYNLASDVIGCDAYWWATDGCGTPNAVIGYSGQVDLQAACEHFVIAGFVVKNGSCANLAAAAQGNITPSCANTAAYSCPHIVIPGGKNQVIMYIHIDPRRRGFGQINADTLQFFFGTPRHQANNQVTTCVVNYGYLSPPPGCTPHYYTTLQIADIVFGIDKAAGVPPGQDFLRDWNLYTGAHSLGSAQDDMWSMYNSDFSGGTTFGGCAGNDEVHPNDYVVYCDPEYDTASSAGEFSPSLSEANTFFSRAAVRGAVTGMTIPVFLLISRFESLNAWNWQSPVGKGQSSLVDVLSHGFSAGNGFWSLLNMRCNPNYSPANFTFRCGGGNPELIRRGFSEGVHKLSPFFAKTPAELEILSLVFDSLLKVNPATSGASSQVLDWGTTGHNEAYNPLVDSCILKTGGVDCASYTGQGTTTIIVNLRNDLKFHSGQPVTADDVCFSILTYEYVPSANFGPNVANVASCIVKSAQRAEVKLANKSPFFELNIGLLPILRAVDWQPINRCNWVAAVHDSTTLSQAGAMVMRTSPCGSNNFDPMQQGIINGHGPWVCKNSLGQAGGPCTSSGTQVVTEGGTISLSRFTDYSRCCPNLQGTSLQKESWADKNDDGKVDILDIADAALYFGQDNGYWDHPLFGVTDNVVDIGEISTVAFYFDHGVTKPFAPSALTSMDPRIDPYSQPRNAPAGFSAGYIGAERSFPSSGKVLVHFWTTSPSIPYSVTVEAHTGDPGPETVIGPVTVTNNPPTCANGLCDYDVPVTLSANSITQSIEVYVWITLNPGASVDLFDPNALTHVGGTSGTGPYGVVAILPP